MSVLAANPRIIYRESCQRDRQQQQQLWGGGSCSLVPFQKGCWLDRRGRDCSNNRKTGKRDLLRAEAFWPDLTRPAALEMEPINDSEQLDQILAQARELSQPVIIDWMAAWCRKCIYLKPKLEKLAAEFDTKTRFYCVDVNKVPQSLVKRGNISKMPTIQLWKDGEMKEEVIGGHKAWLVIEEVREMVQKYV